MSFVSKATGLECKYGNSEDRTEVWNNETAGMAVRIEWIRVVGERGRDW